MQKKKLDLAIEVGNVLSSVIVGVIIVCVDEKGSDAGFFDILRHVFRKSWFWR